MPRVIEAGQSFALRTLIPPKSNQDMRVAAIGRYGDVVDFDGQQTWIRHLEADELDHLLSHRF
jgi:hypothetical protein